MKFSYSLLAFCGSPSLSKHVRSCQISNDLLKAITGYKEHHMEFISESYGGVKSAKKTKKNRINERPKIIKYDSSSEYTAEPDLFVGSLEEHYS